MDTVHALLRNALTNPFNAWGEEFRNAPGTPRAPPDLVTAQGWSRRSL